MILVKFEEDPERGSLTLRVNGHAGQNVYGQDLVCAAASILELQLAQKLIFDEKAGWLRRDPRIKRRNGDAILTAWPRNEYRDAVVNEFAMTWTGYLLLARKYPQYVMLENEDGKDGSTHPSPSSQGEGL